MKYWGILGLLTYLSLLTGCLHSGFDSQGVGLNSESLGSLDARPDEAMIANGKALYQQNCATCHSSLDSSLKRNRSYKQIVEAIRVVSSMSRLSSLSESDIKNIAAALSDTQPDVVAPGQPIYQCASPAQRGVSEDKMRRLIKSELTNTFIGLLSTSVVNNSDIQNQLSLLSEDIITYEISGDIGEYPSTEQFRALVEISLKASDLALSNSSIRNSIFGSCSGNSSISESCVKNFITSFGRKAFRRPLTTTEESSYLSYYKDSPGPEGLGRLLMRFILSPEIAFHIEVGEAFEQGRLRLTDYEVASRISYRLAASMPDNALMAAADKGELGNLANVKAHAKRIVESHPQAKLKLKSFFSYYMQIDKYSEPDQLIGSLHGINVSGLKEEFQQETYDYINHVVWTHKGTLSDLFTSQEVFPRSARMAKVLETEIASGSTSSTTPKTHAGLILRPGFLSSGAHLTAPFHRALTVRKNFLCETFGFPDNDIIENRVQELGDISQLSRRKQYEMLTDSPTCVGCHAKLNPVGFVLEGYDQLGIVRTEEPIFDEVGNLIKKDPIDTVVSDSQIRTVSGSVAQLNNAQDLLQHLSESQQVNGCFAKSIFEFQRWRSATIDDHCALAEIEEKTSETGSILEAYTNAVANEDIFWKK